MNHDDMIVGIDLGTTNSEIAVFFQDKVQVVGSGKRLMLPSCVGLSPSGELLIGEAARNQQLLYPELTVRSIKRKMGSNEKTTLGDKAFTPQEISAFILKELAGWAEKRVGRPVAKAVISVPAYFSDAQRNATREAGALAGLETIRILNEPTAASLAYGYGSGERRTVMIYDLGGGTFDVSIVSMEKGVTEVLASHGNNHLGGDDLDQLLVNHLVTQFQEEHGIDLTKGFPAAMARLWRAAENAKKRLSMEPFVKIREEALVSPEGKPLHLEREVSREEFEAMISPLIESTLDCVSKAMNDAGKRPGDLDAILLVGGSTRIPMVQRAIEERAGLTPRHDIHPDLCVALGAGVLASRISGHEVGRVLVDVTPYSFGPSYLGEKDGFPYPYCYHPIIRANTPLPVTRTERYFTSVPYQKEVIVEIFQGEDADALKNIPVGSFQIKGLNSGEEPNTILCKMSLDIDGILTVTAIEKATGKSKQITIHNALRPMSEGEIATARKRLQTIYEERSADAAEDGFDDSGLEEVPDDNAVYAHVVPFPDRKQEERQKAHAEVGPDEPGEEAAAPKDAWSRSRQRAEKLLERSRSILEDMHEDDREEAIDLHEQIQAALSARDLESLNTACLELNELLFFVEGK
ncbi:MAG: hypothetical protein B5M55_04145 [Desulfococcus sp. 4484_242]|nr:MAG: hypothetical protein B5M55_04145 [Desulfococcus sp. 4484_242]